MGRLPCSYILLTVSTVFLKFWSVSGVVDGNVQCSSDDDCGWNSICTQGQCWCTSGYEKSFSGIDCVDSQCLIKDCVECQDKSTCRRCSGYLEDWSGKCSRSCGKEFSLVIEGTSRVGKICHGGSGGLSMIYVAVIIAVSAAMLLVTLLAITIRYKLKTDKERGLRMRLMAQITNQQKHSPSTMSSQFAGLDNYSYDSNADEIRLRRLHYYHQVTVLNPQMDTFLVMLKDAKLKCQSVGIDDTRQLVYRNLIHQLCRVLTVINDRMAPMPPDGNLLLDWAQRVLRDYLKAQVTCKSEQTPPTWTLTSAFELNPRPLMNGTLRSGLSLQSSASHIGRSGNSEQVRGVSEISGVHLLQDCTEPIEV